MTTLTIRCAWCPQGPVTAGVLVSHTICAKHAAEMDAELDRLYPLTARLA